MKPLTFFVSLFCLLISCLNADVKTETPSAASSESDIDDQALWKQELQTLDQLIAATEQSLVNQKALRTQMMDFQAIRTQCHHNPDDNTCLLKMVQAAHQLLEGIQSNHLEHNFDSEFLRELGFFSKIATKRGIPRPE